MIYAVYRRLSFAHGWSLVAPVSSKKAAEDLAATDAEFQQARGHDAAESKVVEYDAYEEIENVVL